MQKSMRKQWLALWKRINARSEGDRVYADIVARYNEPHRAYHTLAHIEHCLNEFEHVRHLARNPNAVEMALWFHDAVYATHAHDNEERSAGLALQVIRNASISARFGKRVAELILTTVHKEPPKNPDAQFVADIDLSSLGLPKAVFDENTKKIRREYAWVPEDAFVAGRSKILKSFLGRPHVYSTLFFRKKYERRARRNIERYLARVN